MIDLNRVQDLTAKLRENTDAEVAELAKAAYEMSDTLIAFSLRLSTFSSKDEAE